MTVRKGKQYCGEHQPETDSSFDIDDRRVKCPLDPTQQVFINQENNYIFM